MLPAFLYWYTTMHEINGNQRKKFPDEVSLHPPHIPKHFNQSRYSSRLENSQQTLSVMGQVVECSCSAASSLHVVCVLHGPDNSRHHLR